MSEPHTTSRWILQGNAKNPEKGYDVVAALRERSTLDWLVYQYRRTASAFGCPESVVAEAEILTEVGPIPLRLRPNVHWVKQPAEEDENKPRVWLRVRRVLDEAVRREVLKSDPVTADLPVITFPNSTNHPLDKREHVTGLDELVAQAPGREMLAERPFFFTAAGAHASEHLKISLIDHVDHVVPLSAADDPSKFTPDQRAACDCYASVVPICATCNISRTRSAWG